MIVAENSKKPQINAVVAEAMKDLSPWVKLIRYDIGEDWTGQPGIFFRVLLSDEACKPKNRREIVPRVVDNISDRLDPSELGLFPYFNFRSESEQAVAREAAWN